MITFLTSPKAFTGEVGELQRRAIVSWLRIHPDAEVILYGRSLGAPEIAASLGLGHVPDIEVSPSGVPRFDAIAAHAASSARHDLQVYLNCDILLPSDLLQRIAPARLSRYLIIGQRIDLAEDAEFDSARTDWISAIRLLANDGKANLHPTSGVDYFIFKRGMWTGLAPLIIGRGGYDGALVAFCLRRKIPVIDATWAVPALHQFHDYGHLRGGKNESHRGGEAQMNCQLHDIQHSTPDIGDANFRILSGGMEYYQCRKDWLRALETGLRYRLEMKLISYGLRAIWRVAKAMRLTLRHEPTLDEVLISYSIADSSR